MGSAVTKLVRGTIGVAAGAVRHVAWYVSHLVRPDPRERD
jgi:hypothetical protein